ncbi:MAG: hypothetical protein JSV49_08240 [Thermoplasmata archaeon]|nr:MAG: hypothetical protein JSV49_08240 [Thermoplasmata archaeon]
MFYFSINKRALATIKREAKATDREIIGVLVGRVYDNLLVVNKAVSGEQASGITRVKLDNATLAKIVNEIMTGDLEGNILGWYHSHPGFGVFMSHTDIGTQELLQQFSPKVAALVIDPKEDKFGVFTLNSNHGVIQIPDEQIFKFKDGEDGIPQDLKDAHLFEAKLEITPEAVADRIRYVIECTKAHWPEKKCLVCGAELKFDEASRKWYCPTNEDRIKKQLEEAAKSRKPDKAHYKCKECEIPLKYSKKINAWYCKK